MESKRIQDDSLVYEVLRHLLGFALPKFFRTIEVKGMDLVPQNEPILFAANHQLGLMDPLAIILSQQEPVVYMARADIFKSKLSAWFLRLIKVTPIYRIRDGYENLSRNDKQLQLAVDVLVDRKRLGVMPEGNHGANRKLRPLVKGLFRIAFTAEQALEGKAHVKIIPIGIDHGKYLHAGGDLIVQVGKPIQVADYLAAYTSNQAQGINKLKNRLADDLSSLMQDIRGKRYNDIYALSIYGCTTYLEHLNRSGFVSEFKTTAGKRFEARVALSKWLDLLENTQPERLQELSKHLETLEKLPGDANSKAEFLEEMPTVKIHVAAFLASLLAVPGLLLNLPAWCVNRIITNKLEDKQMYNTFAFTIGLIFNLFFYPLICLLLSLIFGLGLLKGLALLLLTATLGITAEKTRQYVRMYWCMLPFGFGKRRRYFQKCQNTYKELNIKLLDLL